MSGKKWNYFDTAGKCNQCFHGNMVIPPYSLIRAGLGFNFNFKYGSTTIFLRKHCIHLPFNALWKWHKKAMAYVWQYFKMAE